MTPGTIAHEEHAPPAETAGGLQSLEALELLLAAGWQIDQPALVRLSWSHERSGALAYHFILARDAQRSLVVIADSPQLQRFLIEHSIAVA